MNPPSLKARLLEYAYPGLYSRGYSIVDGTAQFYQMVSPHVRDGCTLLDLGAGRGATLKQLPHDIQQMALFSPRLIRRIGVDVDPAVKENPFLAESHLIDPTDGYQLPLSDGAVDVVLADWVVEHLKTPEVVLAEIRRVLKPGGIFALRTVNRWHYVAIGASIFESRFMRSISRGLLRVLQRERQEHDVFPKFYRSNTPRRIKSVADASGRWSLMIRTIEAEPSYMMGNLPCALAGVAYERTSRWLPLPKSTIVAILKKEP
jgi:SAM-dependent methyltransferase